MLAVHVHARVRPERVAEFLAATQVNAQASLTEPGVLRFDVIQDQDDPAHVVLVEVYRDAEAWRGAQADPALCDVARHRCRHDGRAPGVHQVLRDLPGGRRRLGEQLTVTAFEFATAARIVAGPGRAAELPGLLAGLGSRVLVCTGANPGRNAGLLAGLDLPAVDVRGARRAHDRSGPGGRRGRARAWRRRCCRDRRWQRHRSRQGRGHAAGQRRRPARLPGGRRVRPEDHPARRALRRGAHYRGHRGGGDRQRRTHLTRTRTQGEPAQPADDSPDRPGRPPARRCRARPRLPPPAGWTHSPSAWSHSCRSGRTR